jgi:hypothetical protein
LKPFQDDHPRGTASAPQRIRLGIHAARGHSGGSPRDDPKSTPNLKTFIRWILPFAIFSAPLVGAPDSVVDAVSHADDLRVSATIAANPEQMGAILSDDLVYAHSSGTVNDKASYIKAVVSGKTKYISVDYESRDFEVAAPGIVLMRGRCMIHSSNSGTDVQNHLSFLAVWREENGVWRFLAWQSCHLST